MDESRKTINRLTISTHDWEHCLKFLQELSNHAYGSTTYEALLIAAVIFYIRPFSGNERGKDASADSKVDDKVLEGLTDEECKLHETLLTLRMKAIAHSEWTYHPTRVHDNGIIKSMPFAIWKYFRNSADMEAFSILVAKVRLKAQLLIFAKIKEV